MFQNHTVLIPRLPHGSFHDIILVDQQKKPIKKKFGVSRYEKRKNFV